MVAVAVPEVLPLFIPVLIVFWWARRRYLRTSREVKRYEATTRSPVFASFSSILKVRSRIRHRCAGMLDLPGVVCSTVHCILPSAYSL